MSPANKAKRERERLKKSTLNEIVYREPPKKYSEKKHAKEKKYCLITSNKSENDVNRLLETCALVDRAFLNSSRKLDYMVSCCGIFLLNLFTS